MALRSDLFAATLNELRNGQTQAELTDALAECINRAHETGKPASLSLVLKIKPNGRTGQYEIRDTVTSKLPEYDKGATLLFSTPEGNLQRTDPNQPSLDLRQVEKDKPGTFKEAT